ncbi:MAG: peptidylprolyl isomerase [Anaerolineaceae bacterium]|nr:peptidylprolyl isomerase [Anaerolineaceae bacterium]
MAKKEETNYVSKKVVVKNRKDVEQQKKLIIGAIVVVVVALLVIAYGVLSQTVIPKMKPVATVNKDKISIDDFVDLATYSRYQMKEQYNYDLYIFQLFGEDMSLAGSFASDMQQLISQLIPENATIFGEQIIDGMIDTVLMEQQAEVMGISVSEAEIDARIEKLFQYNVQEEATATPFPTMMPTTTLSEEQLTLVTLTPTATLIDTEADATATPALEATLEPTEETEVEPTENPTPQPTPTEYTYEGFQSQYQEFMNTLSTYNIGEDFFRTLVRQEILRGKVLAEVTKDVKPLQTQVWARHILVADKTAADVIHQRLLSGEDDFATIAAEVSIDPGNNTTGGDLGWFPRGVMVDAFETAVFDELSVGEISEPVETDFGFHIIQKLGEEDRSVSENQYQSILSGAYASWLADIKESADIKKNDNWIEFNPTDITITMDEIPDSLFNPGS